MSEMQELMNTQVPDTEVDQVFVEAEKPIDYDPNKPTVALCRADNSGCGWYRIVMPGAIIKGWEFYNIFVASKWEQLERADVIVVQRVLKRIVLDRFEAMRKNRKFKLVHEFDDDLWNVPPWNPVSRVYEYGQQHPKWAAKFCELSDMLWASTEPLAAMVRRNYRKPAIVVHNGLDMRLWQRHKDPESVAMRDKLRPGNRIRIGWAGSPTHLKDLELVAPVLFDLDRKYDNLEWRFFGYLPDSIGSKFKNPVVYQPHVAMAKYSMTLFFLGLDIGIAPLVNNVFNESKSFIKILEYWACGWPVVVSPVHPYQIVKHGEDGFKARNLYDWAKYLGKLIESESLRKQIGAAGFKRVREEFTIQKFSWTRVEAIDKLLGITREKPEFIH